LLLKDYSLIVESCEELLTVLHYIEVR